MVSPSTFECITEYLYMNKQMEYAVKINKNEKKISHHFVVFMRTKLLEMMIQSFNVWFSNGE